MKNKKAFTLTELLVALCIVGAIAALSIPSLLNNINNKMLASQIKSFVGSIEDLAGEQLVDNKTQDLSDTDFGTPSTLLSSTNFDIAKTCSSAADCWSEEYRLLNNNTVTSRLTECGSTIMLKNGTIVSYSSYSGTLASGDEAVGMFCVDVNGNDGPNTIGRDVFWFIITKKARIVDDTVAKGGNDPDIDAMIAGCKSGSTITYCLIALMNNNWKMPY